LHLLESLETLPHISQGCHSVNILSTHRAEPVTVFAAGGKGTSHRYRGEEGLPEEDRASLAVRRGDPPAAVRDGLRAPESIATNTLRTVQR
jgi:hypothetical protein